jgi:hypothetical protein
MMLQQATQIDHSHPDSASSELILTGPEVRELVRVSQESLQSQSTPAPKQHGLLWIVHSLVHFNPIRVTGNQSGGDSNVFLGRASNV